MFRGRARGFERLLFIAVACRIDALLCVVFARGVVFAWRFAVLSVFDALFNGVDET